MEVKKNRTSYNPILTSDLVNSILNLTIKKESNLLFANKIKTLLPSNWGNIIWTSPLSSDGSPIQFSVDLSDPANVRILIDPMNHGLSGKKLIQNIRRVLSIENKLFLDKIVRTKGCVIPYMALGFHCSYLENIVKIYLGSGSKRVLVKGICKRLVSAGVLNQKLESKLKRIENIWQTKASAHGISFLIRRGEVLKINVYFRSMIPFNSTNVGNFISLLGSPYNAEKVNLIGNVLGLDKINFNGFHYGPTLIFSPNSELIEMKMEQGKTIYSIPQLNWSQIIAEELKVDMTPILNLESSISKISHLNPFYPEVLSLRIFRNSTDCNLVSYYSLPPFTPTPDPISLYN